MIARQRRGKSKLLVRVHFKYAHHRARMKCKKLNKNRLENIIFKKRRLVQT